MSLLLLFSKLFLSLEEKEVEGAELRVVHAAVVFGVVSYPLGHVLERHSVFCRPASSLSTIFNFLEAHCSQSPLSSHGSTRPTFG